MANFFICFCLLRLALPACLGVCCFFRQNVLSLVYLLLLFCVPMVKVPTEKTMAGSTGRYLKAVIVLSLLASIAQLSFQIVLLSMPPYGYFLPVCDPLEKILRHIGFVRLDTMSWVDVTINLSPEVVMLVSSTVIYVLARKFSKQSLLSRSSSISAHSNTAIIPPPASSDTTEKNYSFFVAIGKYLCLVLLCVAGVMRPSILSGVYFITFLGAMTWWGSYRSLGKPFAIVLRCICALAACHILLLFVMQTQWIQELTGPDCDYCRYLGLTVIYNRTSCDDDLSWTYADVDWTTHVNPVIIWFLYYILLLESRLLMKPPVKRSPSKYAKADGPAVPLTRQISVRLSQKRLSRNPTNRWQAATRKVKVFATSTTLKSKPDMTDATQFFHETQKQELMRSMSPPNKYSSTHRTSHIPTANLFQDPLGSVTITDHHDELIQLTAIEAKESPTEPGPSNWDYLVNCMVSIIQMINKSSYIGTNIIMMAWSITYHSWITFVLLLWASMLWMVPNQRRAMLRCSPYLVCYSMMLLLAQYIYSMDLTEEELPQQVKGVNLKQIGFEKPESLPCKPLLAKCLYTIMFWVTLRQYMQEKMEHRRSSALEDMVAPLAVTVTTATRGFSEQMEQAPNAFMTRLGLWVKNMLTQCWICVVAIMLFIIGITGHRMTVLRIIYMALFLIFILTFQLSYNFWRKMLFSFWITVIVYSMTILVSVYTYQFDHFPEYWENYLGIPVDLQLDIGLEKFETGQLFIRLLTPTFFLIITVVQLHYFHKEFLEVSDITSRRASTRTRESSMYRSDGSSAAATREMEEIEREVEHNITEPKEDMPALPSLRKLRSVSKADLKTLAKHVIKKVLEVVELCWLFLELHTLKIVLLSIMFMCIYDVCAVHFILLLLPVVALMFSSRVHIIMCHICAVIVSVLFLAKMIYQIDYISHDAYSTNCTDVTISRNMTRLIPGDDPENMFAKGKPQNFSVNTADWLGFKKTSSTVNLPRLTRGYIGILLVATVMALVNVRQRYKRLVEGRFLGRPHSMFPYIKRMDAEKDLISFIKYLFNYGYYKFGLDICLMATVALIGIRMDMYAVLYSIWLCVMCMMKREKVMKVWVFFQCTIVVLTPLQYAMAVGLPPSLCFDYPWYKSDVLRRLQDWMFLPDYEYPPSAAKLACDFILLLLVCRQSLVFRIEKRHIDIEYPGGSNKDVTETFDDPDFINPLPDYISYVRSWLDILKRGILSAFLWITLAIVFLAGTNRVNVFSIGYLVGSFIFLWQGEDYYLRPIKMILHWWNLLLGYNVIVITTKTFLQIVGCVYVKEVQEEACWFIQLFSIACIKKFPMSPVTESGIIEPQECTVNRADVGLVWDGICFGCLLMMRRLFCSYYFMHLVDETKAMTILASRGAELIEELSEKQIKEQQEEESMILDKIKQKMDRIKATQKKSVKEPSSHFTEGGQAPLARSPSLMSAQSPTGYHTPIDEDPHPLTPRAGSLLQAPTPTSAIMTVSLDGYLEPQRMSFGSPPSSELLPREEEESFPVFSPPPARPRHRRQSSIGPPWLPGLLTPRASIISQSSTRSHHTSIRSGDYYMFEDLEDDDELEEKKTSEKDEEDDLDGNQGRRVTLGRLFETAMKTDVERAATYALTAGVTERPTQAVDQLPSIRRQSTTLPPMSSSFYSALSEQTNDQIAPPSMPSPAGSKTSSGRVPTVEEIDEDETGSLAPPSVPTSRRPSGEHSDSHRPSALGSEVGEMDLAQVPEDQPKLYDAEGDSFTREQKKALLYEGYPELSVDKVSIWTRIWTYIKFAWAFVESAMVSLTKILNRSSRDYRYVVKVLTMEKKMLKDKDSFGLGVRQGSSMIWQPLPESTLERSKIRRKRQLLGVPEIRVLAPSLERGLDSDIGSMHNTSLNDIDFEEMSAVDQPPIVRLLLALWYAIISHSDIVCYFMVFLNQIKSATILSLPLPLMVFLWGTLTVPRPTKTFWVTIIAYTEAIVIIKCMFQFEMLPWNQAAIVEAKMPFYPPRIIGIERKPNYALYDLMLLLFVFFHRFMLKSLGLWKSTYDDQPTFNPDVDEKFIVEYEDERDSPRVSQDKSMKSKEERGSASGSTTNVTPERKTAEEQKGLHRRSSEIRILENRLKDFRQDTQLSVRQVPSTDGGEQRTGKRLQFNETDLQESPDDENDAGEERKRDIITVHTELDNIGPHLPGILRMSMEKYLESVKNFFQQLLSPFIRVTADVYAYMFICDFFNFMVVIFGFAAFGTQQGDGGVSAYLEENKVPVPFLVMLILQFALIIIDRALFLRKYILGKIMFQFILVVGVHIWMFFILPLVTDKQFNAALPPQMWYMVKCFYLLLSAYQIRCGYPTRILGNFLCKRYNIINMVLFKVFMLVPFLFELRALMDWIWTDTSMTLFDWLKMEDIFAHIFQLKCARRMEAEYPQPRGERKAPLVKYLMGGGFLFVLIGIIWFPLVLFALGNTVGKSNLPTEVTVSIKLGPYDPIYKMAAQGSTIRALTEQQFEQINQNYKKDRSATTFLSNYVAEDIAVIVLSGNSTTTWGISPPDKDRLIKELNSTVAITVKMTWEVNRFSNNPAVIGHIVESQEINLGPDGGGLNPTRRRLLDMLQGVPDPDPAVLAGIFPKFIKVTNRGKAQPVKQLMDTFTKDPVEKEFRNLTLKLNFLNSTVVDSPQWWEVAEVCTDFIYQRLLQKLPEADCQKLIIYTFNDKLFPATLSIISGGGIIGLYVSLVLVAGKFVRNAFFTGLSFRIMFDELPYVDRILQLCLDIYLVRESGELDLEEDLFAKLVFLYRSPETLIKWTRPREEDEGDGDGDEGPAQPMIAAE